MYSTHTSGSSAVYSAQYSASSGDSSDQYPRQRLLVKAAIPLARDGLDAKCCCARCFARWWDNARYLAATWREHVVAAAFLVPIILEYMVTINVYNANIFDFIDMVDETEYALMDLFVLVVMGIVGWRFGIDPNGLELIATIVCAIAHFQWAFHSPFDEWPVGTPTENDSRHRTEYYDTHVMVFAVYVVLFARRFPLPLRDASPPLPAAFVPTDAVPSVDATSHVSASGTGVSSSTISSGESTAAHSSA